MEHRKDCAGPREMLDDALLRRILADMTENGPSGCVGGPVQNKNRCGCQTDRKQAVRKPCGCQEKPMEEETGVCGCPRQSRHENEQQETPLPESCIAGEGIPTLAGLPLVMAYVPNQGWEGVLEPEEALEAGTLFTGLHFPWYPSKCRKNSCGRCRR